MVPIWCQRDHKWLNHAGLNAVGSSPVIRRLLFSGVLRCQKPHKMAVYGIALHRFFKFMVPLMVPPMYKKMPSSRSRRGFSISFEILRRSVSVCIVYNRSGCSL